MPGRDLRVSASAVGKPFLEASPGIEFNLSHSSGITLIAFATVRVGVDVELVRPIPDAERITAIYFSHREQHALARTRLEDRQTAFFRCWTRKEAYVKAIEWGVSPSLAKLASFCR